MIPLFGTFARLRFRALLVALSLLGAMLGTTVTQTVTAPAAHAQGAYSNATIADKALSYVGQWGGNACNDAHKPGDSGGQCKAFVNCIVWMVSGHSQSLSGYMQGYLNAGGVEIRDVNQLVKGDIVQIGNSDSASPLHTTIIVSRVSGNTFNVVDSNHNYDEKVMRYNRVISLSSTQRAFRMGTVGVASGVGTRLVADVNGDGRADAVVMFRDTGTAMVALAQAAGGFASPQSWSYGHDVAADRYFLADVNGDGRADLVAFYAATGDWYASLSSGSGFWGPPVHWAYGHGVGTSQQFLADVNGDHRADVVTFDANTGDWWVSLSSGGGFWSPQRWISGHGYGSTTQLVGDFNGDGKVDAAVYFASNGNWYVGLSTGSYFGYPGQWSAGHGMESMRQLAGDLDGDHRADIAYFYDNQSWSGIWEAGTSSGGGFWQPTYWAYDQGTGSTNQFLADVNGDGRADEVTFYASTGNWYVDLSSGSGFWGPQQLWISGHGANS